MHDLYILMYFFDLRCEGVTYICIYNNIMYVYTQTSDLTSMYARGPQIQGQVYTYQSNNIYRLVDTYVQYIHSYVHAYTCAHNFIHFMIYTYGVMLQCKWQWLEYKRSYIKFFKWILCPLSFYPSNYLCNLSQLTWQNCRLIQ